MSFIAENRRPIFIAVIVTTLFIFLILGVSNALSNDGGQFFAGHPTATPPVVSFNRDPLPISFSDLDSDPFARQGQQIQVTGRFTPHTAVACIPHKGPQPGWSLIADNLQMDGVGLRDLARLVPEGAELTVSGIWRLYEGPLGCGKEPPDGSLWYLEARRVHQPNPLIFDDFAFPTAFARVGEGAEPPESPPVEETETPTPTATQTEDTATPTVEVTATPTLSVTTAVVTPTITNTPTPRILVSPTPLDGNGNGNGNGGSGESGGGNNGTATGTPDPNATSDPNNPGGVPTSPPGTVVPATLPATIPPGGYDGDGY